MGNTRGRRAGLGWGLTDPRGARPRFAGPSGGTRSGLGLGFPGARAGGRGAGGVPVRGQARWVGPWSA